MTKIDIANQRLRRQQITAPGSGDGFDKPGDLVAWMGAVQAQDYAGALWAVGLRLPGAVEADIERAIAERRIVRTWPMRGTIHFVAPADARWMVELLAPRVVNRARHVYQKLGLDQTTFARSRKLIERALEGGRQLSRTAIYKLLDEAGISTAGGRGLHIVSRLAQDGVICFGAREGRQATFTLLDEWAPAPRRLRGDEALAELASRYFASHGPATLQDFSWWSGLTATEARAGIEMVKSRFIAEVVDGRTYWLSEAAPIEKATSPAAHLLPVYDEYTVAYRDRSAALNPSFANDANYAQNTLNSVIVIDGQIAGIWKRAIGKREVRVTLTPYAKLKRAEERAIEETASRYGKFLGAPVVLQ